MKISSLLLSSLLLVTLFSGCSWNPLEEPSSTVPDPDDIRSLLRFQKIVMVEPPVNWVRVDVDCECEFAYRAKPTVLATFEKSAEYSFHLWGITRGDTLKVFSGIDRKISLNREEDSIRSIVWQNETAVRMEIDDFGHSGILRSLPHQLSFVFVIPRAEDVVIKLEIETSSDEVRLTYSYGDDVGWRTPDDFQPVANDSNQLEVNSGLSGPQWVIAIPNVDLSHEPYPENVTEPFYEFENGTTSWAFSRHHARVYFNVSGPPSYPPPTFPYFISRDDSEVVLKLQYENETSEERVFPYLFAIPFRNPIPLEWDESEKTID